MWGSRTACVVFPKSKRLCLQALTKRSLITATAASSLIGCFLMGIGGNLPIALAPGMGLNAYFTYNVVGYRGEGSVRLCLAHFCNIDCNALITLGKHLVLFLFSVVCPAILAIMTCCKVLLELCKPIKHVLHRAHQCLIILLEVVMSSQ